MPQPKQQQRREPSSKPDWPALRLAFITDPSRPTVREYAGKIGIKEKTLQNRVSEGKWLQDRDEHWEHVGKKSGEKIADLQAVVVARDTSQQLAAIASMKATALRFAGGSDDHEVVYEKPHEAVAAYERLVKLERLILGESTEHIKVDDARQMVAAVIQIIREEVRDGDTATRIAARLAALGDAGAGGADTQRAALN
ncbi:hypothetical protein GCM10017784_34760 [Deinococcus indicus]|uniref:hypothetical protein n=1 Tax=Deinococcus indicus TaxID=223556 RepID=UPI0017491802|nr:hypothetical protein [Deinococcus indicus]GHG37453.1 hypothetical protein GCM10017784_34760 [Deinococcus indicus]